ncbi:MAG TPA: HAMP domain-containing sensor histidine kinase [Phycisphaerae bacterium]|nr:HAMP domain-containing sensor histidine kinase [Phycisphaerae bacterium]
MTVRSVTSWSNKTSQGDRGSTEELEPLLSLQPLLWYIQLRWAFIAVSLVALAIERIAQPDFLRPQQIVWALGLLALLNVVWLGMHRSLTGQQAGEGASPASPRAVLMFAHGQIATDLLVLTAIVRFTGGHESPLAIFYVFHMALGSLLLPIRHALLEGLWAIGLYAAVALGELAGVITLHYPPLPAAPVVAGASNSINVGAAIIAMSSGVLGTLYLTGTIAARLRRRELQLQTANAALRASQAAVRELQERRSRFMQTAAHRLKSPLATIQTLAGLVRDGIVREGAAQQTFSRIVNCCKEGTLHVTELLTLARVQDADPQRHELSYADVGEVVAEQCAAYQPVATGRGVSLACYAPKSVNLLAHVDPRDLGDCIANLVDNALKYTPSPGKVSVWVERPETEEDGAAPWIAVHVDDTGIGFDADLLAQLHRNGAATFDAYRRGNNALAAGIPGSGLGLAIIGAVVEQAGGRIDIRSVPGCGTQCTLRLPPCDAPAPRAAVTDALVTCSESPPAPLEPGNDFVPGQRGSDDDSTTGWNAEPAAPTLIAGRSHAYR